MYWEREEMKIKIVAVLLELLIPNAFFPVKNNLNMIVTCHFNINFLNKEFRKK